MPKINEMLLKAEGFQYSTSLDLNIGYYHIRLSKNASNLCTINISWGNTSTSVSQWDLRTQQPFSNRKRKIYFMDFKSSVRT